MNHLASEPSLGWGWGARRQNLPATSRYLQKQHLQHLTPHPPPRLPLTISSTTSGTTTYRPMNLRRRSPSHSNPSHRSHPDQKAPFQDYKPSASDLRARTKAQEPSAAHSTKPLGLDTELPRYVVQEFDSVPLLRKKSKSFLASQGMVKGITVLSLAISTNSHKSRRSQIRLNRRVHGPQRPLTPT